MTHERWAEMRTRYQDGELDPETRELFESHLESCEECRHALDVDAVLGQALHETLEACYPADLESRLRQRLAGEAGPTPLRRLGEWLRHGEFRVPVPVAAAAVLMIIVTGIVTLTGRVGRDSLTDTAGRRAESGSRIVEVADAEQEIVSLLTRTRTLLLALSTAHPDSSGAYDLTAERALSRNLISEYRILQTRAESDNRAEILELIHDLEVILLDLSTGDGPADARQVAMLQGGITDRSLIYRLSTYEPAIGGD